jgi:hypothetical protein
MSRHLQRRRKRQNRKKHSENVIAAIIIFFVIVITGFIVFEYFQKSDEIAQIDKKHCKIGSPEAITVVLIDHTDTINITQKISLEHRLLDIAKKIPKNSQIKIYSVSPVSKNLIDEEISICNSGDDTNVSNLYGNKELTQKRYLEGFIVPLHNLLSKVITSNDAKKSPIMKSIQAVNILSFQGDNNKSAVKTLYIISDLLENDANYSLYKESPKFTNFKDSAHFKEVRTDLQNVNVEILFLNREGSQQYQTINLKKFWEDFLFEESANLKSITNIEG